MTAATEMQTKVDKTGTNMDRIQQFTDGELTKMVTLDGGEEVPSIYIVAPDVGAVAENLEASQQTAATNGAEGLRSGPKRSTESLAC